MRRRSWFTILAILVLGVNALPYAAPAVCAVLDPGMARMESHGATQEAQWSETHPLGGCADIAACSSQLGLLSNRARILSTVLSSPTAETPALAVAGDPLAPPTPPPRA